MQLHRGTLWTMRHEGEMAPCFDITPGKTLFGFTGDELKSVRRVSSGLNTVVEVTIVEEDGSPRTFALVGPRGRLRKAFAEVRWPI